MHSTDTYHSHHHDHEHSHAHAHHGHHHHHHHHHTSEMSNRRLLWVTLLNVVITVVEIIGGLVSNSLSLLSDAIHNLGDSSAVFIAFLAGKRGNKQPDKRNTFGYKRIEILAALFNGVVLIAICLFLFVEAYKRFKNPEPIHGRTMFIVAVVGLLANLFSVLILQKDKNQNLNVKAAYLHLLGDTLSSVAVILGGLAIWFWGLIWLDPLITTLVGIYIIWHTWSVVRETVDILMQSSPLDIDIDEIKTHIEEIEGVQNMHHVHVWKLDDVNSFFEAHINLEENILMEGAMKIKTAIEDLLKNHYNISHTTLQIEYKCCPEVDLIDKK